MEDITLPPNPTEQHLWEMNQQELRDYILQLREQAAWIGRRIARADTVLWCKRRSKGGKA